LNVGSKGCRQKSNKPGHRCFDFHGPPNTIFRCANAADRPCSKQALCGRRNRETSLNEGIVRELEDKDADHAQKPLPDEATAMAQSQDACRETNRARCRPPSAMRQQGQKVTMRDEEAQRREVGGDIDHFRGGRSMQEIKSEEADKEKDQETAGAGPEKPS
jgi:hypothetical protein